MPSQEQIDIIKATVPIIEQHGNTVTEVFYKNLLGDNPNMKAIFNQANQATGHQAKALAAAVYAYAKNIENLKKIEPALNHMTQKHVSLFIRPEQYEVVGKYLLDAFRQVLGEGFHPEIRSAWAAAYTQLADTMIAAEARLYDQREDWTDWRDFLIAEKRQESTEITSFILKPAKPFRLPAYLPGQYISIRVDVPDLKCSQTRQYSLSDKFSQEYYRISVKKELGEQSGNGGNVACLGYVSNVLHDLKHTGDIVQLSPPSGDFYLDPTNKSLSPVVFISAGVGITPLIAMLNTVVDKVPQRSISWIQGARSSQSRAFSEHIRTLKSSHDRFKCTMFVKNVTDDDQQSHDYDHVGRVDLNKCDQDHDLFLNYNSTQYYICGPESFMSDIRSQLQDYGVKTANIKSERFGTGDLGRVSS